MLGQGGFKGSASRGALLDRDVTQRTIEPRQMDRRKIKDVYREAPYSRARLSRREFTWSAEGFPNFRELTRQQAAENRMNVHAGVIVGEAGGFAADGGSGGRR